MYIHAIYIHAHQRTTYVSDSLAIETGEDTMVRRRKRRRARENEREIEIDRVERERERGNGDGSSNQCREMEHERNGAKEKARESSPPMAWYAR